MINKSPKRFEWSDGFTVAMQEAFEADGFLVIDGFASPDSCDKLRAQSKTLIDGFDANAHSVAFSATGQTHAASDYFTNSATEISFFLEEEAVDDAGNLLKQKQRAVNKIGHALHELDPVFADFSYSSDIKALAKGAGLEKPSMVQSMVICKQPYIGGEVNTHQDSTFLFTEPETCVGFWIALEDATVENGCMWAAAGGHHSSLRHRFRNNGQKMEMITLDETPMPHCDTALPAPKGTLVVLHGRLPHHSAPNRSAVSRYAYAMHLIDETAEYLKDNWLQRPKAFGTRQL